jgi:type IV pilus assembly protein PilB
MNAELQVEKEDIMRTRVGAMTYLAPKMSLLEVTELKLLTKNVLACIEAQENRIVIDFATVRLVNSNSLSALLEIQDLLVRSGGFLKVTGLNATIKEIFTITGFSNYIGTLETDTDTNKKIESSTAEPMRLGELLVKNGLVSKDQMKDLLAEQSNSGKRLGQQIIDKGLASEDNVLELLAEQLDVPMVRLRAGLYDPSVVSLLDRQIATRMKVLPLFSVRGVLTIATADPQDIPTQYEIEDRLGLTVSPVLASSRDIVKNIAEAYSDTDFTEDMVADVDDDFEVVDTAEKDNYDAIDELASGSPVINLINSIIQRAVRDGASDIHIEPFRNLARVRFRVDGVLYEVMTPRIDLHPALVSRLKVMANLDIAERRLPQDGRIQVHTRGRKVDLRFSSLPGLHGEKVVLRVLDKNQTILDVNKLGMTKQTVNQFKGLLDRSYGLVLVTGPTGSGKTTTLYAGLNYLNSSEKNIVTVEDPVEYQLDIINQNEVKAGIGLGFAKMLRHILRQDPDIVMVGEIRDRETAQIAVQAALTGHLVLSTLHTNDGIGAITRMIDMGIEPYLLSSALLGVVAQRLVRTICPSCKTRFLAPRETAMQYHWDPDKTIHLAKGRGCPDCYDSGYKGRAGIHEIVETTSALQQLILTNPNRDQLNEYLITHKVKTLRDHGLKRVLDNITTLEEVSRVINS